MSNAFKRILHPGQNRWRPVLRNHRLFPMILATLSIIALSAGCTHMQFARQWNASKQTPPANRSPNPLLINAVINRQHKRLAQLLRQGVDPNALVPYGRYNQERAVHLCVRNDDSTALRILIAAGANLNYGDERGETALIQAIYYDRPAMARYLLEQGANPNLRMRNGLTALHVAADRGYTDVARALLLAGADANARTNSGISPLMLAAKRYESLVRLLLAHRARVNQTTEAGTTALMYAAHTGAHPIVRILLDAGARADMRRSDGKDALYFASAPHYYRFDLATTIQLLLDAGVNPDQTYGERNLTALMLTAEWNLLGPMQTLLANGVDLHRRDAHGRSAADYCRTDDCRNLLSAQESIDSENTLLPDELPQTEEIKETEQAIFQNSQPPTLADMRQAVQANQNPLILVQNYLDYFTRRGYWLDPEANARRTDIITFLLEAIRKAELPIDNQLADELWRFQQATDDRLPEILLKHNIIGLPVHAACTDALYRYIQSDRTDRFAAIEYYVLQSNVWECADAAARVIALLDAGAPAPEPPELLLNQAINRKKFNAALLNRIVAMGALNASANPTPPLCTAIRTGHLEALELLLLAGALPVCRDDYNSVSMIPADVYADRFAPPESKQQMLQLLPTSPQRMLDRAARAGNTTEAYELLSSNPHIILDNTSVYLIFLSMPVDVDGSNSVDVNNGVHGSHNADGSNEIISGSIVNGSANINRTALGRLGDFNMPILLYALQQKNVAFVDFLLRNDVPPDFTYQYHTPALITAARILPQAVPLLLAYKSDWPAEELNEALLRSAEKEQFDNMRLLLLAGASVHVQTYNGLNLLHFARRNRTMYRLLRDLGLHPDKEAERFLYEESEQNIDPESGAESDLESGTNRPTDRRSEGIDQENANESRMILEVPRELELEQSID